MNTPSIIIAGNDALNDNSSYETNSTADRNDYYQMANSQGQSQNNLNNPILDHQVKLLALIEKERGVLKELEKPKNKDGKKDFSELKNNIQMIQENLDNFFIYNIIKVSKKKLRKDDS